MKIIARYPLAYVHSFVALCKKNCRINVAWRIAGSHKKLTA